MYKLCTVPEDLVTINRCLLASVSDFLWPGFHTLFFLSGPLLEMVISFLLGSHRTYDIMPSVHLVVDKIVIDAINFENLEFQYFWQNLLSLTIQLSTFYLQGATGKWSSPEKEMY